MKTGRDIARRLGEVATPPAAVTHALIAIPRTLRSLLRRYRALLLRGTALVSAATAMLIAQIGPAQAQVVPDGTTATSVTSSGAVTDVTTGTISHSYGVNSFGQFDVGAGQTVNIHAPGGTRGTVNIVHGSQSQIMGTVQGLKGGKVGGDLYIANPNGVVVGPSGVVRAGSVNLSTPRRDVLGGSDPVGAIIDGSAPLSNGDITVDGEVSGQAVTLRAGGNVRIGGTVRADNHDAMAAAVNGGKVRITSGSNIAVSGTVSARGQRGGSGGDAYIYATSDAVLEDTGIVSVAAEGDGAGGFLEFSARDVVTLRGRLDARSESGTDGTIYIDPISAIIDSDDIANGGNIIIEATANVRIEDGVTLSSRRTGGGNQLTADSIGDSGNIRIAAPVIEIGDGVRILAHATDGYAAGNVNIIADWPTDEAPIGLTSITVDGATITGGDVKISARTVTHFAINYGNAPTIPDTEAYADALEDAGAPDAIVEALQDVADGGAAVARDVIEAYYNSPVIPGFSAARASVTLRNSTVDASGIVTIESVARAESDFTGPGDELKAAVAATLADARTIIETSTVSSTYGGYDSFTISSSATTNADVLAQTAAVSFSLTDSLVAVRDSQLSAPGTRVALTSTTNETQHIRARQSNDTEAVATVLSIRAQQSQVLIDAETGWANKDSSVSANNINVTAQAERNLWFEADADGNGDDAATVGAVLSFGSGATRAIAGGDLEAINSNGLGGYAIVESYVMNSPYTSDIEVKGGTFADTSTSVPPWGLWSQDWLDAVKAIGEDVQEEAVENGTPGTNVTSGTGYAFGLNGDYVQDEVESVLGGTWNGLNLGALTATADEMVRVDSQWRLENFLKRTEVLSDAGSGITGALSFGAWSAAANSTIGTGAIVGSAHSGNPLDVEVKSRIDLPTISPYTTAAFSGFDDNFGGVIPGVTPVGRSLEADDLAPDLYNHIHPQDFHITNIVGAGVDGSAASLDIAIHNFDVEAKSDIADGATLDVGGTLLVEAVTSGNILSRSVDPDAADVAGSGTGIGGAIQVLRIASTAEATIGALTPLDGAPEWGLLLTHINVRALNSVLGVTYGGARSNVDTIAVGGALSIVDYKGQTRASLSGDNSFVSFITELHAIDTSLLAAMAGGGAVGADGYGVSAALVFADRDVVADISDFTIGNVATGRTLSATDAHIFTSYLTVEARDASQQIAVAASGSGVPGQAPSSSSLPDVAMGTRSEEYEDELGDQTVDPVVIGDLAGETAGFSLAADFAGAFVKSRVVAAIETDSAVSTNLAAISAMDISDVFLSAGATLAGSGTSGLGGSVAMATIRSEQIALDRGGERRDATDDGWMTYNVTASDLSDLRVLAASRAGEHILNAGVATAVFVDTESTTRATAEDLVYVDPVQLNQTATADGLVFVIAGALAPDVAEEAAEEEYDDGDPSNDPPSEPSPDLAQSSGISVGLTFARVGVNDEVVAGLIDSAIIRAQAPGPDDNLGSNLDVAAANRSEIVAHTTSLGAGGAWSVAGTGLVVDVDQSTSALIDGENGDSRVTGSIALDARNSSIVFATIGAEAEATKASFGSSVIAITDARDTVALIAGASFAPEFNSPSSLDESVEIELNAETHGISQAYQRAGGGDAADYGLAVMVGALTADWTTAATIEDSAIEAWQLHLNAEESGQLINNQDGLAAANLGGGAAGSVSTVHHSDVIAAIDGSDVAITTTLDLYALGQSIITNHAVQSGRGEASAGAVYSHFKGDGEVRASIDDSTVEASSVDLTAQDKTWREVVANASVTPGATGVAGGLTIDKYKRNTIARIDGGSIDASTLDLVAKSHTRTNNVAIGRANGGALIGVAAQVAWIVDDRDVIAVIRDAAVDVAHDVTVTAERTDAFLLLMATAATSTSSVGIGAGVLRLGGATSALIDSPTAFHADDVTLRATDRTVAVSIGFGAGGEGSFSGVGSLSFLSMGRRPDAAEPLANNDRGAGERQLTEDVRSDIANLLRDETDADSDINTSRDSTISAVMTVTAGTATIAGDLTIEATDSRAAVALAGELRAGGVNGALDYLDKYVRIGSVTTNGIDVGYRNVDLTAEGDKFEIEVDLSKPWNPDGEDETEFPPGEEPLPEFPPGEEPLPDEGDGGDEGDTGGSDTLPGSDAAEEFDDATGGPGSNVGLSGWSVGAALTRITLGGLVDAGLVVHSGATVDVDGDLAISALSTGETIGIAAGSQTGASTFGASASLVRQTELVRARIDGEGSVDAHTIDLDAQSNGAAWSVAALLVQSQGIAGGATISVTDLDASAETRVTDTTVSANTVDVGAEETTSAVALAFSGGNSGSASFTTSIGVNSSRSLATAYALGADITARTGDINIHASRDQSITGLVMQFVYGGSVNIGAALAIADVQGTTLALAEDSDLDADDDVKITSDSDTALASASIGIAASSSAGVSGSLSYTNKSDITRSEINDSDVTAGDSVLVQAQNGGAMAGLGGGDDGALGEMASGSANISVGSSAGVGVSLSILNSTSVTEALITGASVVTADGVSTDDGVQAIGRDEDYDRTTEVLHGVAVVADNDTTVRGMAVTIAGAGQVAVSVQVPIILADDTVRAKISNENGRPDIDAETDVNVVASNDTSITTFSLVAAASGTVSVGADLDYLHLGKLTEAVITHADVEAGRDIAVDALSHDRVSTVSLAGAFGLTVGVSGVVQVAVNESETSALIAASTITAGDDLLIRARAPRHTTQVTFSAAGGYVGVGGSVLVYNARDTVFAGTADAPSGGSPLISTIDVNDELDIEAQATFKNNANVVAGSGGLVSVNGAILVTQFEQSVTAKLGDRTQMVVGRANDLSISANQVFDQTLVLGSGSGGYVGVGATIGFTSLSNTVYAGIGDYAKVDVSGTIDVHARGERNVQGGALAVGGGVVALQASVLVIRMGTPSDHDAVGDDEYEDLQATDEQLAVMDDDLQSDDSYEYDGKTYSNDDDELNAVFDRVLSGRRSVSIDEVSEGAPDTIKAEIGTGADVTAGGSISVTAEEAGSLNVFSGGANGGLVASTGGILVVNRGSTVQASVGGNADIFSEGGNVTVKARANVDLGNALAFAGNLGLVSINGAVSNVETARTMNVLVGSGASIESDEDHEIRLAVEEDGETSANTASLGAGLVSLGGTSATARATSILGIEFAEGVGGSALLKGGNVRLVIDRDGDVTAAALGARGGVVAGTAVITKATDVTAATIDLGNVTIRNRDSDTRIEIWNNGDVSATSTGVSVGLAAVGVVFATATANAWSEVLADGATIKTGELDVVVADSSGPTTKRSVYAEAISTAGGAVSGVGGTARATNTSTSSIDVKLADLETEHAGINDGGASFVTYTNAALDAVSKGFNAGIVSGGANLAEAISNSRSRVRIEFDGVASVDGLFEARAIGNDDVYGWSRSGSGGAIVLNGARSTILVQPETTIALLGDRLDAAKVEISADREVDTDNNSDSRKVSIVGIGGSKMETTVQATMSIDLTSDITANDVLVIAVTDIAKNADGYNGLVGEGGLIAGTSLRSETFVTSDVEINLAGNRITQGPNAISASEAGDIDVIVDTSFDLEDRLKIDTGGGILLPSASSIVDIAANNAAIRLNGAVIDALGSVDLNITTEADVDNASYVNVYGLAGAPGAFARADYDGDQLIALTGNSSITSRTSTVDLTAGSKRGEGQSIALHSEARTWNGTGIPVPNPPDAFATVDQDNEISVAAGSTVVAATDIRLVADSGFVDPYAYATGTSLVGEGFEDIVNAFGSLFNADDVSFDTIRGETTVKDDNRVTVNGSVTAGAFARRVLHIGPSGNITHTEGEIEPQFLEDVNYAASLEDYITELEAEADEFGADDTLVARIELEIARLRAILEEAGTVDVVVIDDVFASGGNLSIDTEILSGTGDLVDSGDVLIEVFNESARTVEVRDITIPNKTGGVLTFNGIAVDSNSDITTINTANAQADHLTEAIPDPMPGAHFNVDADGSDGAQPLINIRNDYLRHGDEPAGDLLVTGRIENYNGTVQLATADGDVMVLGGEISARTVSIASGGDFFLSAGLDETLTSTPDDPRAIYNTFFADYTDWVSHGSQPGEEPDFELLTGGGKITAVGSVFIYADYLNITGRIQSGVTNWTLDIDAGLEERISRVSDWGDVPVLIHNGLGGNSGLGSIGTGEQHTDIDTLLGDLIHGNASVRWDQVSRELLIDPLTTQGGYIELVGKVISTGGGELVAASGYGHVSVESDSELPMVFSRIDTGPTDGVTGEIKIVDLNRPADGDGSFVVTRYVKTPGGNIVRYLGETKPPPNDPTILPAIMLGTPAYEIADAYAVTYNIGTYELVVDEYTQEQSVNTVGGGALIYEVGTHDSTSATIDLDYAEVGLFGATQLANNPYRHGEFHDVSDVTTTYGSWVYDRDEMIAGVRHEIYRRVVTDVFAFTNYDSHRLAANYDVAIDFAGFDTAKLDVTSAGTVYFDGNVRNTGGQTTIVSTGGDVLTVGDATLETALTVIEAREGSVGRTGTRLVFPGLNEPPVTEKFGVSSLPMLVDQIDHRALDVVAGDTIRIAEVSGDMYLRQIKSMNDADVELTSPGSILVSSNAEPDGILVRGGHVTMTAESGSIGAPDDPIRIGADLIKAHAAYDVAFDSLNRGVYVDTIVADAGDVYLRSDLFIRDGNTEQSIDRLEEAGLLDELWDNLGLRNTGNGRLVEAIARISERTTGEYQRYWDIRGLHEEIAGTDTVIVGDPYDPDYVFAYTVGEKLALVAQGLTPSQITAQEAARNAEYAALHARFGADPYDAAFVYVPTLGEVAAETGNIFWTTAQLKNSIHESLVLRTADTDVIHEAANISAINVVLEAGTSIGEQSGTRTFLRGAALTDDDILALEGAEPSDLTVTANVAYLDIYDDLDITAAGDLTARAENNILISSESLLTLREVDAPLTVRLKSAEGLVAGARNGVAPHVTASTAVLEGGDGGAGAPGAAIVLSSITSLTARATGDVVLSSLGDLGLLSVASLGGDVAIGTPFGDITDAGGNDLVDVFGNNIVLLARENIGAAGNALDLDNAETLTVIATMGDVFVNVPTGDAHIVAVGATVGDTEISLGAGDLVLEGLDTNPAIKVGGKLTLNVRGSISTPATLVPQVEVAAGATFNVSGNIGSALHYLPTAITGFTSPAAAFNLSDLNNIASGYYITNAGHLSIESVDIGNGTLKLLNTGDLHFADGAQVDASLVEVETVASGNDIIIDENLETTGTLHATAKGDIVFAGPGNIDFGGTTVLRGNRVVADGTLDASLVWMPGAHDLTIEAQHSVDIDRISSTGNVTLRSLAVVGNVVLDNVRAGALTVGTYLGDVRLGYVNARTLDIDAHGNVEGSYEVSESIDIFSSAGIGAAEEDLSTPLEIVAASTATSVHLAGELGVNVKVTGPGTFAFTSIETAMRGDGAYVDGGGNVVIDLDDAVPALPEEDRRGIGIIVKAPVADIAFAGTGINANGTSILIDVNHAIATGVNAVIEGRDLELRVGSIANSGPRGFRTDVDAMAIDVTSGAVHIRNGSDLLLAYAQTGGNLDLFVNGTLDIGGPVETTNDVVVLTATGSIVGYFDELAARSVHLNALGGRIGTVGTALGMEHLSVGTFRIYAERGINIEIDDPSFTAAHVISTTGPVRLASTGAVEIDLVGAGGAARITGTSVAVAAYGSATAVDTTPGIPGLVAPSDYPMVTAQVPTSGTDDPAGPDIPSELRERLLQRLAAGAGAVPRSPQASAVIRAVRQAVTDRVRIEIGDVLPGPGDDDDEEDEDQDG